jgi:DNA polymerase I-like protein with 3'-5' exonuclease and polymerase domains
MMPHKSKSCMRLWKEIMETDRVKKISHNMKFEATFTEKILGYSVQNWGWDSMLASHILDNREGITGLKFQSYVQFGAQDYSSEISPYLRSGSKNSNNTNRIEELIKTETGKQKLLMYCGLDSLWEFRLAIKQMKEVGE